MKTRCCLRCGAREQVSPIGYSNLTPYSQLCVKCVTAALEGTKSPIPNDDTTFLRTLAEDDSLTWHQRKRLQEIATRLKLLRDCLEDTLEWFQTGGIVDGVSFDDQQIIENMQQALDHEVPAAG